MATKELTENIFDETIKQNAIVFIDFWAPWCGPCRAFGPVFEKAAEKNPDIVFGKVNTEQEQALAAAFDVRSIPTLMVFRDQVLVFAQPGMLPAPALNDLIRKVRELDMNEVREQIRQENQQSGSTRQASTVSH